MQCEGWIRKGGAFTIGPVQWTQCKNVATYILTVTQGGKTEEMPACDSCRQRAIDANIKIEKEVKLGIAEIPYL